MTRRAGFYGLLFLALATRQAQGQLGCSGATCTVEITMPVSDVLRLSLSTSSIALGNPIEADFLAGYHDISGTAVNVTVKSNRPFTVQLGSVTPAFSYSGTMANPNKPASDLRWTTSAGGLSTTTNSFGSTSTLLSQGAGTVTQPLFLRTLWSFASDVPGTYALTVRLTVAAP